MLERTQILPQLRARGFRRLRVELLPVSERLRALVGGPAFEAAVASECARLAYRLRPAPTSSPRRS